MRLLAVVLALLLGGAGLASAQGLVVPCGDPLGAWDWLLGGTVRFADDHTVTWSPAAGGAAAFNGTWSCDPADGAIVVAWQHGFTDRLDVAPDGSRLSGTNQAGVAIEGRRPQAADAAAAIVDPALTGSWLLEVRLPSPQGPVPVWWTIHGDGSYAIDAGPFSHAGTMTASGSRFDLTATTSAYRDSGRYEVNDWATIVTHGQHGVGRWHRREPALALEVAPINAQLIPTAVPAVTDAARGLARRWQPDALLARIEHERPSGPNPPPPAIRLFFFSPATGLGLWLTVATDGTSFFGAGRASGLAIPNGFLDLPQAWTVARQHGVAPPLERAMLRVWTPEGGEPVLAWSLSGNGAAIDIDAVEGHRLEGDLSGYVAAYNAQWQDAIAGLRRLLARPRSSSPSSSPYGFSSGASSSRSDDDDSSGGTDDGTASQNSWGAGDMEAYDRIQGGTPTDDDCYRYGC